MRVRRNVFAVVLALCVAPSVVTSQDRPCARPPAKAFAPGAVVDVTLPERPPCVFRAVDTPIELRTDAEGRVPGINTRITRGPDGRFFTVWGSEIYVWSPEGRFVRKFGAQGGGPGEFRRPPQLMVDGAGRLFARDMDRWTVFSPNLEVLGSRSTAQSEFGGPTPTHDDDGAALLDDGSFLSANTAVHRSGMHFVIWGIAPPQGAPPAGAPAVLQRFDSVGVGEAGSPYRAIGYGGGDTFWAGPPMATSSRGYELELWRTDGTRLRTLRRAAPWFPRRPAGSGGRPGVDSPPPPGIGGLVVDGSGLLYVFATVANEHWQPPRRETGSPPPPYDPNRRPPAPFDLYVDVIDPASGVLLSAAGPLAYEEARRTYPLPHFRGTSLAVRLGETAEGLSTARIVEYRLFAR